MHHHKHDPIFKTIKEIYIKNHNFSMSPKANSSQISIDKLSTGINNNNKNNTQQEEYIAMIARFVKEKEEKEKWNKEIEKKCELAWDWYYHEEQFAFLNMINSNTLIREKVWSDKSESFRNWLRFEESVVDFFHKEVNDKEGYTKVKGSDWNFATRISGRTVTLRFEKEIEVNLIHFVSIIYEVNYYLKWYPFCHISETLNQPGKAKKCVHLVVELPIIKNRDFLVYGFGINRLRENGTVLILCRGIEEDSGIFQREYKQKNTNKYVRGKILIFGFEIKIISVDRVLVRGLCNVDPQISFIPQRIINFVSEKFAQEMFHTIIKVAKHYEGSEYQNKNPSTIDKEFYKFIQDEVDEWYKNMKNGEIVFAENKDLKGELAYDVESFAREENGNNEEENKEDIEAYVKKIESEYVK